MRTFLESAATAWRTVLSELGEQGWRHDLVTPMSAPVDDTESDS